MSDAGSDAADANAITPPVTVDKLVVNYYRPLGDYDGWTVGATGDTSAEAPLSPAQLAAFGARFEVPLKDGSKAVSLTLQSGQIKDPSEALQVDLQTLRNKEIWVYAGSNRVYTAAPAIPAANTAIVYYLRGDGDYNGYGLHVWQDTTDTPEWTKPLQRTGLDQFGAYYTVHLKPDAAQVNFILHKGDTKDPGPDQAIKPAEHGRRIWVLSGDTTLYTHPVEPMHGPVIDAVQAHWVSADTIAWNLPGDDATLSANAYHLHHDPTGAIKENNGKLEGGKTLTLTYDKAGLGDILKVRFPNLAGYKALKVADADLPGVAEILKGQLLVSTSKPGGGPVLAATGLQIPGVLDDLYTTNEELGIVWDSGVPTLKVWAPTARSVKVHLFDSASGGTESKIVDMQLGAKGVYSATGEAGWKGKYYLYEVEVFVHATGKVEHNLVTDPYSVGLSANSLRSQIADLSDPALAPPGWTTLQKPPLAAPSDITLYELHVRDFSINDATVPAAHQGTFLAFADTGSNGMKHLASLAAAGLTHIHLLPSFDFATVNEIKAEQMNPSDLMGAPDSEEQQAAVSKVSDLDGFNWGYDPLHYTVPEGSYATDPDGTARIMEFRQMIKALSDSGLRVVMDVVYNHTNASGQSAKSVLDRVVPGYYHRLNDKGAVETSTCCQNTASEHVMMEKLMVDSLVTWARAYKVDGFRFDLMGHHMKANILKVRAALDTLTLGTDGVDGKAIYLYGEGWDYGEVANNARGVNATQANMAGTGVGTFNDRLRDAVRGGGPFDAGQDLKKQGFVNGLFYDPNSLDQGTPDAQKAKLLLAMDQIRVGLTGNMKGYAFVDRTGKTVTGAEVDYNGQPAGYTDSPVEGITYAEAHDNQTLFDIMQYKAPDSTDMATRVQMQNLAVDILALGQGVPFFHAGMEMLRSKSLDRDSFNSGDWFNKLDFTFTSNNWGVGLPPAGANMDNWPLMKPLLVDPRRKPAQADILATVDHFRAMLKIRASSKLLRLGNAADVNARVRFHNTGAMQAPGLIVMSVSDELAALPDLDPQIEAVVVLFNATQQKVIYTDPAFSASSLTLHPVQAAAPSGDPVTGASFDAGTFSIPPRVTAVFVGNANFP